MELAREHGPRAIEVLVEVMNNLKAMASARAMAADRILDRGVWQAASTHYDGRWAVSAGR
jgi:hypothetical protein